MKLYDNDEYRDDFMRFVYSLLENDGTNDRANLIIDLFDRIECIDAIPVVRCGQCKYKRELERCYDRKLNQLYYCGHDYGLSGHLKEDFFCCFGERIEK